MERARRGKINIPTFVVHEIAENLIAPAPAKTALTDSRSTIFSKNLDCKAVSNPQKIEDDAVFYAELPAEITKCWDHFSTSLQRHLIECVKVYSSSKAPINFLHGDAWKYFFPDRFSHPFISSSITVAY